MTNTNPLEEILNKKGDSVSDGVIISGKKISNAALREFVYNYRYDKKMNDHDILELLMALDELVESNNLDNDKLKEIGENPDLLK